MNKKTLNFKTTNLMGLLNTAADYARSLRTINFGMKHENHSYDLAVQFNKAGAELIGSVVDERGGDPTNYRLDVNFPEYPDFKK